MCEKGHIAGEQSSRNWDWCRATHRDLRKLELSLESLRLWQQIDEEFGIDTGYCTCGILFAADDAKALADHEAWLGRVRGPGWPRRAGLAHHLTGGNRHADGRDHTSFRGRHLHTGRWAYRTSARRARWPPPCAVRGVETSSGKVSGIVTEYGRICCTSVVGAGGAWTRGFSRVISA